MKAQAAIEFMIIMGAIMILMASVIAMSSNNVRQINEMTLNMEAGKMLDMIASKINIVFLEGDGFSSQIEIPYTISACNYTVRVEQNYIFLSSQGQNFERPILTNNVTQGYIELGMNLVENIEGEVVVTKI